MPGFKSTFMNTVDNGTHHIGVSFLRAKKGDYRFEKIKIFYAEHETHKRNLRGNV